MQTLTVQEAETQLHALVQQTKTTHQPVILTDEVAMPVAILIEPAQYAAWATSPELVLQTRLYQLQELLDTLSTQWEVDVVRQAFPGAWRWRLEGVREGSRHREAPFRQLVVLLQMAARPLNMAEFTRDQLALFYACLERLRQPKVTLTDLAQCDQALIQQDFPVLLQFDDEMIAHYVDES